MSKKKTEKKGRFHLPKRSALTYLLLILVPVILFFIIAIPVVYVREYNKTKVIPLSSELEKIDQDKVIYGDGDVIPDFNFVLYCKNYNDTTDSNTITFSWFAYKNDQTEGLFKDTDQISVKLSMSHSWIGKEYTSSSYKRRVAKDAKTAVGSTLYRCDTASISAVPNLPMKGNLPFIKIKSIPVYAYVTYTINEKGSQKTKYFVLKYEYKDYITDGLVFDEGTDNEVRIKPTVGGIEK